MSMRYPPFDASIDLIDGLVPAGTSPPEAVRRVREAVKAMPGAGWVSVAYSGLTPTGAPWLILYEPGCCTPRTDGVWEGLACVVEEAVRRALKN